MKKLLSLALFALLALPAAAQVTSQLWGSNGELWNPTTSILQDFTGAGYKGGGVPIPDTNDWTNAVSVLDYGAIPDDFIDDSDAFIAAISNCPNYSAVFVPKGRYLITKKIISQRNHFVLRGEDMYETVMFYPKYLSEVYIEEIGWQGGGSTPKNTADGWFIEFTGGEENSIENLTLEFREQRKISPWEYIGANFLAIDGSNCWVRNIYMKNYDSGIQINGQNHSVLNIIMDQFNGRQAVDNDISGKLDAYSGILPRNMNNVVMHNIDITGHLLQPVDNNESSSWSVYSRISTGEGNNRVVGLHGGSTSDHLYTELNRPVTRHDDTGDPLYGQFFDCTYWNINASVSSDGYTAADNQSIYVGYGDDWTYKSNSSFYYEPAAYNQLMPGNLYLAQLSHLGKPLPEDFVNPPLEAYEREGDVIRIVPTDDVTPDQAYDGMLTIKNGAYFKFDLSQATETNVAMARLRFTFKAINNAPFRVAAYSVSDDNWVETNLTTANKPAVGTELDSEWIYDSRSNLVVELDVTSFVASELVGGDGVISLYADYPEGNGFLTTAWGAEEGQKPELIIERVADSVPGAPSAPKGISSTALVGNIVLDWDDNPESDIASYNVYRTPSADGWIPQSGGLVTSDHVDVSSTDDWKVGMMDYRQVYHYWITAVDEHGYESEKSREFVAAVVHPSNDPPAFGAGPFSLPDAMTEDSYSANVATDASDTESDQMYFMKVSGPDWLNVALDGTLSGTPAISAAGNTQVVIQVSALGGNDQATYSLFVDTEADVPVGPPAAPANVAAATGDNAVSLNWDDNTEGDLASYSVYRSTTSGSGYSEIANGQSSSDYVDNTAVNGTTYYYVITAKDNVGNESANSSEVSATPAPDLTPPAAPTGLAATPGDGSISLNWNDNGEGDLGSYNVYRSTTSGSYGAALATGVSSSDYVDNTAANGTTYYYVVTAVDISSNESADSSEVSATPVDAPPSAPTGLSANAGDGSVSLDWDDNGEGDLASYNVYRSTTSGSYSSALATGVISSDYVDSSAVNGTSYYYVVTAVDAGNNESAQSSEVSDTPVPPSSVVVGYYPYDGSTLVSTDSDTNSVAGDMVVGAGVTTFKWETRAFWSPTQPSAAFDAGTDFVDGTVLDDDYFSFTITPEAGVTMDFTSLSFIDRSGGFSVSIASDQDGFATVIDSIAAAGSWAVNTLDLSSLSGATGAIEIRLYFHNGSGNDRMIDNVEISANVLFGSAPSFTSDPVVESDATEDATYSATLADDASDPDSDPMTFSKVSGPAWLSVAANGDLSGTPSNADVGLNSFTVQVDATGGSDQATMEITVNNVNDAPTWNADPVDEAAATEDAAYSSTLADDAFDVDAGATLTYAKVSGPAWLSVAANGDLSGIPLNSDVGANSWTVSVSDGIAPAVNATLNITVNNVNDAPTWNSDPVNEINATEDSAYNSSLADDASDADVGDTLTYAKVSGPAWLSVAANGDLSGTPANGDVGPNSWTVSVGDGIAPAVNATLNITVDDASPPTAAVVAYYPFDASSLTSTDSDINSVAGDMVVGAGVTTFKWETRAFWSPTQPSAAFDAGTDFVDGTVLDDDYFSFTITPEAGVTLDFTSLSFIDRSAGFSVSVASDQDGFATVIDSIAAAGSWATNTLDLSSLSSTAGATEIRLYFHNGSGNDRMIDNVEISANVLFGSAPSFTSDPVVESDATEDAAYSATLANDASDPDSDPMTFSKVSGPVWLSVAANGDLSGTPSNADVGLNSFTVQVDATDGSDQATLNITVNNVNDAPTWNSDPVNETAATEDAAYSSTLADDASDVDASASLTYIKVSGPAWLNVATDGSLSGTPLTADVGANSWTVSVSDGIASAVNATLNITVDALPNNPPAFTSDPIIEASATEDAAYSGTIADDASDPESDPMTFSKVSGPAWLSVAANGDLSGTPGIGDVGLNSFTVQVDATGGSDTATLEITVDSSGPVADFAQSESTLLGSVSSGSISDTYSNDDVYEVLTEAESGGKPSNRHSELEHSWTFNVTGGELVTFYVEAHHDANSEGDDFIFAYSTDNVNFTDMVTVTKTVDDNTAQFYVLPGSTSGTVYIRVVDTDRSQGNNGLDSLYVDALFITSEASGQAPSAATNPDPADAAIDVSVSPVLSWTAGMFASSHDVYFGTSPSPAFQGNQSGTSFSPGTLSESTTYYWAIDEVNAVGTAPGPLWSFTTGVTVNNPPAFTSDPIVEANATEDAAYSATIADDASDPESDPMTFSKVSGPAWLSVASNGDLSGMPTAGDVGLNSFTVQVDATGGSDTATLEITVDAAQSGGFMHVDSITLTAVAAGGPNRFGEATVVIVDESSQPVQGAIVNVTFSGDISEQANGLTDGSGQVVITSAGKSKAPVSLTVTVDSVTHASYTYDPVANVETSKSGTFN